MLGFLTDIRRAHSVFLHRESGVPVSITPEVLFAAFRGIEARAPASGAREDFYYLPRICLSKTSAIFDRFDCAFAAHFKGADELFESVMMASIPADRGLAHGRAHVVGRRESEDRSARRWGAAYRDEEAPECIEKKATKGGNKWIGTGGTSPFGAHWLATPKAIRIGCQLTNRAIARAVKVWDSARVPQLRRHHRAGELAQHKSDHAPVEAEKFAREGAAEQPRSRQHDLDHGTQRGLARFEARAGAHGIR